MRKIRNSSKDYKKIYVQAMNINSHHKKKKIAFLNACITSSEVLKN